METSAGETSSGLKTIMLVGMLEDREREFMHTKTRIFLTPWLLAASLVATMLLWARPAHAATPLTCGQEIVINDDQRIAQDDSTLCDLGLLLEVSTDGVNFVDTDTVPVEVFPGAEVHWRATLTDNSTLGTPYDTIRITISLPASFNVDSHSLSNGTYADGVWELSLSGSPTETALLATTLIDDWGGEGQVIITHIALACDDCSEPTFDDFIDDNLDNNSDAAQVSVIEKPTGGTLDTDQNQTGVLGASTDNTGGQVLGTDTLAETGTNSIAISSVGLILIGTVAYVARAVKHSS